MYNSMMDIWDYRVIKRGNSYGIYEVHYNNEGYPASAGAQPVTVENSDIPTLTSTCVHIISALTKPVLDYTMFIDKKKTGDTTNETLKMFGDK